METFPLFSKLPKELRLAIWWQAAYPIEIFLRAVPKDPAEILRLERLRLKYIVNWSITPEPEYEGYEFDYDQYVDDRFRVEEESTLDYRPVISQPLLACRESFTLIPRVGKWTSLKHGLPAWFSSKLDVLRGEAGIVQQLLRYPVRQTMQNLVVSVEDALGFFFGRDEAECKLFPVITNYFPSLRSVIIESEDARQLKPGHRPKYWLDYYVRHLVHYYWPEDDNRAFVIDVQCINYAHPKEEWITRANCLRVWHNWQKKQNYFWKLYREATDNVLEDSEHDPRNVHDVILESDDELDDPGVWLQKRRPFFNFDG
ncbi:hypothetical protein VHEMI07697 [[Torrubiella] hemipterigena]|uniref:2EXR domain-containing protein n=1 Tax=[Torrubiella] hemipterigena TaxID=1531966 RepID=A0A0A1TNE1_9HYPO|nr:hypothetical protein VHEMI07697 [[Torrubiella] hemipterigena]